MAETQTLETIDPVYRHIKPEADFNKEDLIKHYEALMDAQRYIQTLQQDPENPGTYEDAGDLLWKNSNYYFTQDQRGNRSPARSPRSDLELMLSNSHNKFAEYAERHYSRLFEELKPEDYATLVHMVPLYKTGNKEHDEFVEVMNEARKITEASKDPEKMAKYVQEKVKGFPEWAQVSFMRHGKSDMEIIFRSYAGHAERRKQEIMYDRQGKLRTGFLEEAFKRSLNEAESDLANEPLEKERKDIREKNIRSYYMALVQQVYRNEKAKEKEDKDYPQEKKARDERRKERRKKGMPF